MDWDLALSNDIRKISITLTFFFLLAWESWTDTWAWLAFSGTSDLEGNFQSKRNFRRGNRVLLSNGSKRIDPFASPATAPSRSVITAAQISSLNQNCGLVFFFEKLEISRLTRIIFTWFTFSLIYYLELFFVSHWEFEIAGFNYGLFTCFLPVGGRCSHTKRMECSSYLLRTRLAKTLPS